MRAAINQKLIESGEKEKYALLVFSFALCAVVASSLVVSSVLEQDQQCLTTQPPG